MNTTYLYSLLEQFSGRPLECLTHKKLEKLYGILLNFLLEHDEELSDEVHNLLEQSIEAIARELERQDKKLHGLAKQLIKDPGAVELILSQMTLEELLEAEKRGSKIKPLALRQQFANMVLRSMQNLVNPYSFPPC